MDQANRHAKAFTLLELVVVISIITILAAMAVPRFAASLNVQRAAAAAERVAQDLQYAQQYARQHATPVTIRFEPAANRYTLDGVPDLNHPASPFITDLNAPPLAADLRGVTLTTGTTLTYNGFGLASGKGSIAVACGRVQRTVIVAPPDGQATVVAP
jgi:prepilin-type N-terminal cleavage/methylation domain-containing protein